MKTMKKRYTQLFGALIFLLFVASCITPFEPKGVDAIDNMLVIEGDIIVNDTTIVTVSFSQSLNNTKSISYVMNALVWVESENGTKYNSSFALFNSHRVYKINTVGLNPNDKYKLCVTLSNGKKYETDFLSVYQTPPIDSVGYHVNMDDKSATFYVNTHDSQYNTKYFKWRYNEDWEFHSIYASEFSYDRVTNKISYVDDWKRNRYYCWNKGISTNVIVATTDNLIENRIFEKKIVRFVSNDIKISYVYSMELIQSAISREAYLYWDNMRKISDEIGGIFAPQPSEIKGNITSVSDPNENVIGYISAVAISKKRIFAYGSEIGIYDGPQSCDVTVVNADNPNDFRALWDNGYDIFSFTDFPQESFWAPIKCVDCRYSGTKNKPSYWPTNDV